MGVHFSEGIEITLLDCRAQDSGLSSYSGPLSRLASPFAISMESVEQAIQAVLVAVGADSSNPRKIGRLNISDHGNAQGFEMGDDFITMGRLTARSAEFAKLRPHFADGAIVHLQHCMVGQNQPLLSALAALLNVAVYGGLGWQAGVIDVNFGIKYPFIEGYICAMPDGRIIKTDAPDVFKPIARNLPIPVAPWRIIE